MQQDTNLKNRTTHRQFGIPMHSVPNAQYKDFVPMQNTAVKSLFAYAKRLVYLKM